MRTARVASRLAPLAVAGIALAAAFGSTTQAQEGDPIKLGAIYITSGAASVYGQYAQQGLRLAIEEINESGGVLGRPLTYEIEDSQGKADTAIQAARKLVFQNEVDALVGLDSSGVATALVPIMPELQRPLIITHAATPAATGELCNRYTFRVSANVNQNMKAAAHIAADTGAKRWTTIGPDYAFGHESWEFFGKYLKELDPDVELMSKTAFPRFGNEDFTPYINNVMALKPDGVLISVWGGDLVNFVRQANNLGFFEQDMEILMTVGAATEVLAALGDDMPEGVWLGTRYWFDAHDNPINEKFVKAYMERHDAPPSYNAEGAYAAVYAYKAAMEKAESTDPEEVAKALSGLSFEAPNGTITFREGDHQATVGPTWGKTAAMDEATGVRSLDPMRSFDGKEVTPSVEETGCKMK